MNQNRVIESLCNWIRSLELAELYRVRCDHVTQDRETLGLYLRSKSPGSGRSDQIAQADIVVTDEEARKVALVIEVDPNPNPKKLLGNVFSVLLADNYTPSNSTQPYKIEGTLIIFITLLDAKSGSQKAEQLRRLESALNTRMDLTRMGVRGVRLCYGCSEEEALQHGRDVIKQELLRSQSATSPQFCPIPEFASVPTGLQTPNPMHITEGESRPLAPIKVDTLEDLCLSPESAKAILVEELEEAGIPLDSITARCMFERINNEHGGTNCRFGPTPLWLNMLRLRGEGVLRSEFMEWVDRLIQSGHHYQKAGRASWSYHGAEQIS